MKPTGIQAVKDTPSGGKKKERISMNTKLKAVAKRLTACVLTAILAFGGTPMESLAGVNGNAAGNNSAGIITGSGGDFSANITSHPRTSGKIGIRLSLVDNNDPSKVISVDEDGNPRVVDLLYTTQAQFANQTVGNYLSDLKPQFMYSSVKTQDLAYPTNKGGTGPNIEQWYYDDVLPYTNPLTQEASQFSISDMPPWLIYTGDKNTGRYESRGEDFVDWCKKDDFGNTIIGGDNAIFSINLFGLPITVNVYKDEDGGISAQMGGILDGWSSNYNPDLTDTEATENAIQSLDFDYRNFEKDVAKRGLESAVKGLAFDLAEVQSFIDTLKFQGKDTKQYQEDYDKIYNDLKQYNIDSILDSIHQEHNMKEAEGRGVTQDYLSTDGTADEAQNQGQTAGENAVLGIAHLQKILALSEPGQDGHTHYVLQTESMRQAALNNTNLPLQDASEDWVLLVEPIMWLTIFPENTTSYGIHTKIYGTVSNIMDAFRYDSEGALQAWADRKTFNWKALAQVWGALSVKNDFTFANGWKLTSPDSLVLGDGRKAVPGNYYDPGLLSDTNRWKDGSKSGWGANVYWRNAIYGSSSIDTWDKANHPNGDPAPAPDPTNLPQEADYGDKSKDFTITKWYVTRTYGKDGKPTDYVVDVQTRKDTPHKINILNEGTADTGMIWEVEKWATGKEALAPKDGDLTSTFEDYYNKNAGESGGTYPVILNLKPDDPDKILYVKLVAKKIVPYKDTDLTIVKVKDNQDGSTTVEKLPGIAIGGKYDASEKGWEYLEDIQTPNAPTNVTTWQDVPTTGTPGSTPQITLSSSTRTV